MNRCRSFFILVLMLALSAACAGRSSAPSSTPVPEPRKHLEIDPESRYGLMLHLSKSEVMRLMRNQGFRFEGDPPDATDNRLRSVEVFPDETHVIDEIAVVNIDAGSMKLWHSTYVALWFANNELVLIFEYVDFAMSPEESEAAFKEMKDAFTVTCGPSSHTRLPFRFREATIGGLDVQMHAHWICGRYTADVFVTEDVASMTKTRLAVLYYDPLSVGLDDDAER